MRKSLCTFLMVSSFAMAATAQSNYALNFDGTGTQVAIPGVANLDITGNITVEAWINLTSIGAAQEMELVDKASNETTNYRLFLYNADGVAGNTQLGFWNTTTTAVNSTTRIPNGVWTHVAAVITAGSLTFYINSVAAGTFPYTVGAPNAFPLTVGKHTVQTTRNFNGRMDQLRIWNIARTQAQLKQFMYPGPKANDAGLVAWYPFNNGSGTTATNATTNTTGADGTLSSAAMWVASPVRWSVNGLALDGSNDHIPIGAPLTAASSYTKEAWVYCTTPGNANNILSSYNSPFWIHGSLRAGNNRSTPALTDPTAFPVNTWTHVAVTFNGSNNQMILYRNGTAVNTVTASGTTVAENIFIGCWNSNGTLQSYLGGQLDEVRIWNVVRTPAEIAGNMNTELDPLTQTNLVAYYTFNQGNANGTNTGLTTLQDQKGNFNGTLTNFAMSGNTSNFVTQRSALIALPVTWRSFTADYNNGAVELNWSTEAELNNKAFTPQHSSNGTEWTDLGTVVSQGNSRTVQNYHYTHNSPANGINYYRIKQTDIDNTSTYSKLNTVNVSEQTKDFAVLNTIVEYGSVQVQVNKPITLLLYNDKGSLLLRKQVQPGRAAINVSMMSKGAFIMKSEESVVRFIIR